MISEKLKTLINEYKAALPEHLVDTFDAFDWVGITLEIAAKYRLTPKQEELFISETMMMLFEITDPTLFKINLVNHIGVSEMIAHNIIMDVNTRVVTRLQTELERVVGDAPEILAGLLFGGQDSVPDVQVHPYSAGAGTVNQSVTGNTVPDPYHEDID